MKRLLTLVMFSLIVLQSVGFVFFFFVQHELIRHEMREEMMREDTDMVTFDFSPAEFQSALVGPLEMRREDCMYDIRSVERIGDRIIIRACRDHREESLLGILVRFLRHGRDEEGYTVHNLIQVSFMAYMPVYLPLVLPGVIALSAACGDSAIPLFRNFPAGPPGPPPKPLFYS